MIISLRDRVAGLHLLIPKFKVLPLSFADHSQLREKESFIEIPGRRLLKDLEGLDFSFLFDYDVFPHTIMDHVSEWQTLGRRMEIGDIIVQQVNFPPVLATVRLIFGVRILEIFRSSTKVGFSYGTLQGHAEQGAAEFFFRIQDDRLQGVVHTFSLSSFFLGRLVAPVLVHPYQQYCAYKALERMHDLFLAMN